MSTHGVRSAALTFVVAALGCGSVDDTRACPTGESIACACSDGRSGSQVCADDGSRYEPCVCTGPIPSTSTGVGAASSTTASSTVASTTTTASSTGGLGGASSSSQSSASQASTTGTTNTVTNGPSSAAAGGGGASGGGGSAEGGGSPLDGPWARIIGGVGKGALSAIAVDSQGFIDVVGTFGQAITLGGHPYTCAGTACGFVAQLDTYGNFRWVRMIVSRCAAARGSRTRSRRRR
jgi:hypothetical protein